MDKIFHPNERAWISEPFPLEEAFEQLNTSVAKFLPSKNQANVKIEAELLQIKQDPSKDGRSLSEQLSIYLGDLQEKQKLGRDDFFKVKIKDDEMYTKYNYGITEEDNTCVEDPASLGKELVLSFNNDYIDCEDDRMSEWSLDDMDDDEMEPRWKHFGTEKLKAVVERHTSQLNENMEQAVSSASEDDDSDINVISDESEDEELVGVGATKRDTGTEHGSSATSQVQSPVKSVPEEPVIKANEDEEFKDFNSWASKTTKQNSSKLELHQIKKLNSFNTLAEKANYERLLRQTDPQLASVPGETFQDDPIKANSSMPILASPISKKAKSTLQALAIYISHQDDPLGFHWKSSTVQQQINEDIRTASLHNRQTVNSQKIKTENMDPDMFVNMQKDFLVTVSFFHPKDTDNAAVDGIHKVNKSKDEPPEIIVGGRARRREIPAPRQEVVGGDLNNVQQHTPDTSRSGVGNTRKVGIFEEDMDKSGYLEPKLAMELNLLSTNTLSDLREAFRCENDLAVLEELHHPRDSMDSKDFDKKSVKTLFPSGMMLINDTIYTDSRGNSTDYCAMVNEWASSLPHKDIGSFQKGELSTTKIRDLNLRFGYPYVYIHQGSCEHIVVFNSSRKLHSQDYNLKSAYPYVEGQIIFKTINCRVDNEYIARWAVLDCKRFPENPMLVCTQCLENYCYDEDGNKVDNFSLFPFKQVANTL